MTDTSGESGRAALLGRYESEPLFRAVADALSAGGYRDGDGCWNDGVTIADARHAERLLVNLGVYPLGCLDPLGGFHMATNGAHEHEEGDPGCRLVVALGVYFGRTAR